MCIDNKLTMDKWPNIYNLYPPFFEKKKYVHAKVKKTTTTKEPETTTVSDALITSQVVPSSVFAFSHFMVAFCFTAF